MKVILSIKPEHANKIFEGTKRYEFRRAIFKNPYVKKVLVYSSSPVKKIIGEFEIDCIIIHELDKLWNKTRKYSGITEEYFLQYFNGRDLGFAIKIKNAKLYKVPKCIREDYNMFPPQSFMYMV